jgi:hypothetical protein
MPKQKTSTAKSRPVRDSRLVTSHNRKVVIAFQRTYVDGPLAGLTVNAQTREVTPTEAAGLSYYGKQWSHDNKGNATLDRHIRMIHPGTDKLKLENYELTMEWAALLDLRMKLERIPAVLPDYRAPH